MWGEGMSPTERLKKVRRELAAALKENHDRRSTFFVDVGMGKTKVTHEWAESLVADIDKRIAKLEPKS